MHADELAIDAKLVRRLIADQFSEWATLPLSKVHPRGTDNAVFRLGETMVVRLPRRARTRLTLLKERRWLPILASTLPLASPVPLADGLPAAEYPFEWSIYSWLPGEPATPGRIRDHAEAAIDLATFLFALQRTDPTGGPPPGEHNFFRGAPLSARDAQTREAISHVDSVDREALTAAWNAAMAAGEWTQAPVWIHGDLDARNVLAVEGQISGVIDWGGLAVGDPAADVMVAWKMLPADARGVFRSRLHVDDATWTRARGWVVSQAVIALAYYTEEMNPTLVAEARRWLAESTAE
jgi:aminoglycoside phosphotransferase (APT) family kinase protein